MPAISIVTSGHFSTSPRVWKEADALAAAGYDVEVFGVRYDPLQADLDDQLAPRHRWRFTAAADFRPGAARPAARWWARGRRRAARLMARWGWARPAALCLAPERLAAAALRRRADLTIVHLEAGLFVADRLARQGLRLGVDMEDWHSANAAAAGFVPAEARLLARAERRALSVAAHRTTTSAALAAALARAYGVPPPAIVRNSLPGGFDPGPAPAGDLRLLWCSQTVGPGRGLETLFDALRGFDAPWRLALAGRCSLAAEASARAALGPHAARLDLPGFVPADQLPGLIARHDVGLALETDRCLNAMLTSSNKIFHYLQCGLPAIATATPGQTEVLDRLPDGGWAFPIGDAAALCARLATALGALPRLRAERRALAAAADREFGYERSAETLLASVRHALAAKGSGA